ncbi:MAG: hypothetical protein K8R58_03695 [Bacteroidales bacterium]|nr:hypothetical protein [Bacteroidales bacterium]
MKYILIFLLLISSVYAQEVSKTEAENKKTGIKSINEISYQLPIALGYSHIRNFNNKFLLGTGIHLGGCAYWPGYIDLFLFKVFVRNLFSKYKFNKRIDYDIGVFMSYPHFDCEVSSFYGLISSGYINVYKFKIGMNMLIGAIQDEQEIKVFPFFALTPNLVYKF